MNRGQRLTFAFLVMLACAVPWDLREPYLRVGPITMTTGKAALVLAACTCLAALAAGGWRRLSTEGRLAAVLSALFCAGTFRPDMPKFALRLAAGAAIFAGAASVAWRPDRLARFGLAVVCAAILASAAGAVQPLSGDWGLFRFFSGAPVFAPESGALRLSGTMLDPTSLAVMLAAALPWIPYAFRSPTLITGVMAALTAALMGTLARGPLLVGLAVAAAAAWKVDGARRGAAAAGLLIPLLAGALFWPAFQVRWGWRSPSPRDLPFTFYAPPPPARPGQTAAYPFLVARPEDRGWPVGTTARAWVFIRKMDLPPGEFMDPAAVPVPIQDLQPGEEREVTAGLAIPTEPGRYLVTIVTHPEMTRPPQIGLLIKDGRAAWETLAQRDPPPRWAFWQLALAEIAGRPWLGLGPERFRNLWHERVPAATPDPRHSPYNLILEAWVNGGALAGIPFTMLLLVIVWRALALLRDAAAEPRQAAAALSALAWLAIGMTESFFQSTSLLAGFWLSMGLAVAHEARD